MPHISIIPHASGKLITSSSGRLAFLASLMKITWLTDSAVKVGLYREDLATSASMKTHIANLMKAPWPAAFKAEVPFKQTQLFD